MFSVLLLVTACQELNYDDSSTRTVNSYSGYETIAVNQNSPISAARFDFNHWSH